MAKIILAFDCSSSACSVALQCGDATVKSIHQHAPMQQAQLILPMIQRLLAENGVKINQLDAIAFGCGPGSFTGARMACSVAQGLAFGVGAQIIPISSMAAMAQAAYQAKRWPHILVAVDARANQIYWASYVQDKHNCVSLVDDEMMVVPTELSWKSPTTENWYGVGDAWSVYSDLLEAKVGRQLIDKDSEQVPTAEAVLSLANYALEQGIEHKAPHEALPVYLNSVFRVEKK